MTEGLDWIWFQDAVGYCSQAVDRLVEAGLTPRQLWKLTAQQLAGLGLFTPKQLADLRSTGTTHAEEVLKTCRWRGYQLLTPESPLYPTRLKNIDMMPAVLYVEGSWPNLEEEPAIAVVGSRKMSNDGARVAYWFAQELSLRGFLIVAGLAEGIDSQGHLGAVEAGKRTIAVLGSGLDITYPIFNQPLRQRILEHGAVVTEYQPGTRPNRYNFPARNRIISGLSQGVLVAEATIRSGSLITAGHALAQNRDVFAVPYRLSDENGQGCLRLIQQGAKAVVCPEDIVEEYLALFGDRILSKEEAEKLTTPQRPSRWADGEPSLSAKSASPPSRREVNLPEYLNDRQREVYRHISGGPRTAQYLQQQTGYPISEVLSTLTILEIEGLIRACPGGVYAAKSFS